MWKTILSILLISVVLPVLGASERAEQLATTLLIADTHIDVPFRLEMHYEDVTRATERGEFDYPRARSGGLNVPFMSIFIPAQLEESGGAGKLANTLIDRVEALVGRAPNKFAIPYSTADVSAHKSAGLISLAMGLENGAPLAGKMENLQYFHGRGIRYITLAHGKSNHISDSSYDQSRQWGGLSPFGKELVPAMNNIGMMIDISHISDDAFYDVMKLSKAPVIASHSSARHFTPGLERNMDDHMIRTLAKNGGVIQINIGSFFLTREAVEWDNTYAAVEEIFLQKNGYESHGPESREFSANYRQAHPYPYASLEDVLDHIDHVVKITSIDAVGIGSDFDGVGDSLPAELKDVSTYPNLIDGLLGRGYSETDIEKILGGNLMRVWQQVEQYADSR